MKSFRKLLGKYVGRFGILGLVLFVLDSILDRGFFCPCKYSYNIVICVMYCIVPALGLLCVLYFMDLSLGEDNTLYRHKHERISIGVLSVLAWFSLFFLDGRYIACGFSDWEGVYITSQRMNMKWCMPTGNETSVLESEQRTLHLVIISQVSFDSTNMLLNKN